MTDYSEVDPPRGEKDPTEYSYVERRAEILQLIEEKGHPWGFNYSRLGRRYGVSHEQIRKDFATLKEWYRDRIGSSAKVVSDLAYRRIIKGHLENGDLDKARKALDSWNDWLFESGESDRAPKRTDVTSGGETIDSFAVSFKGSEGDE